MIHTITPMHPSKSVHPVNHSSPLSIFSYSFFLMTNLLHFTFLSAHLSFSCFLTATTSTSFFFSSPWVPRLLLGNQQWRWLCQPSSSRLQWQQHPVVLRDGSRCSDHWDDKDSCHWEPAVLPQLRQHAESWHVWVTAALDERRVTWVFFPDKSMQGSLL